MQSLYSVIWLTFKKTLAVVYERIEDRQNLNNSCYKIFDKEGNDLNSALSSVKFFKAKQGKISTQPPYYIMHSVLG